MQAGDQFLKAKIDNSVDYSLMQKTYSKRTVNYAEQASVTDRYRQSRERIERFTGQSRMSVVEQQPSSSLPYLLNDREKRPAMTKAPKMAKSSAIIQAREAFTDSLTGSNTFINMAQTEESAQVKQRTDSREFLRGPKPEIIKSDNIKIELPPKLIKRFNRKNVSIIKKVDSPYMKYSISKALEKKASGFK